LKKPNSPPPPCGPSVLTPTPTPEDDEEYEDRHHNYEADQNARQRRRGEDVIWRTHLERQEYNLNQRARALDIRETHLCRHEQRFDCREAEHRAARTNEGSGSGSE
jgi:DNA-binding NtrC family response regulator